MMQPDISKYSGELLPILFSSLNSATLQMEKEPRVITKTYYALEMFCENLGTVSDLFRHSELDRDLGKTKLLAKICVSELIKHVLKKVVMWELVLLVFVNPLKGNVR